MESNNGLVQKIFIGLLIIMTLDSCGSKPSWADNMNKCLAEEEIDLLVIALKRFEKVLDEKISGETLADKYVKYLEEISQKVFVDEYYHELLIKETTKKMLYSDFYDKMWQKSEQWVLNDGNETGVYLVNGYAEIPQCLAESGHSKWLKRKVDDLKTSGLPIPSSLAQEILNEFHISEYKNPQIRAFIALSLCYTQSIAYYDKKENR